MRTRRVLERTTGVSGDDALRTLCFADAVFRQRYEGWNVLGRKSWATVVRTRSRDLGHDIALKVLVNLDPELLQRVREEVRAVQVLATPYLVHTYSLFDRGTVAWFEMEVVDGPNLQQELDRLAAIGERLPLVRAYEIALAVSRCVWHAHCHGVLHRDLKPANLLLPHSERPAAKVRDFGIARLAAVASATPPGMVTGTPRFASPEALAGQAVGPPHDVYGLGATLYTLLTGGRPPHRVAAGAPLAALRRLRLTTRPTPLRALAPEVDPAIESILLQALAADHASRPSPGRLVRTLERAQARVVAAACRHGDSMDVSVSRWRVLGAGTPRLCGSCAAPLRVRDPPLRSSHEQTSPSHLPRRRRDLGIAGGRRRQRRRFDGRSVPVQLGPHGPQGRRERDRPVPGHRRLCAFPVWRRHRRQQQHKAGWTAGRRVRRGPTVHLPLTDRQVEQVRRLTRTPRYHEFLLIQGDRCNVVRVPGDPFSKWVFTTNPKDLERFAHLVTARPDLSLLDQVRLLAAEG